MPTALVSEHLTGVVNSRGNEDEGWLELIIGPMFSGKTTELMQRVRRHRAAGRLCLVVKSAKDTRYTGAQDVLSTHDRMELPALSAQRLRDVANVEFMYRVIAVDEGQFFPDLATAVEAWANAGKIVIVSALDGDFRRKPFKNVLQLIPLAEDVMKKSAVCNGCRGKASFTFRLTSETTLEVVGGSETYSPLCRRCYNEKSRKARRQEDSSRAEWTNSTSGHRWRRSVSSSSTDWTISRNGSAGSRSSRRSRRSVRSSMSEVDFSFAGLSLDGSPAASISSGFSIR